MMPFTDTEIYEAVKNNLDKVSSYVNLMCNEFNDDKDGSSKRVKSFNPSRVKCSKH